ncbi:MAG: hypothetical protein IT370_37665 [Deltaproteobacteria bacterium]|nr:hypothetical protein [Deltaproteobacteria bacterium]
MRVRLESDSDIPELALADAAINSRVGAVDYGGEGPRSVVVRLLAKPSRGRALKRARKYAGSFAEHLVIEGPAPALGDARALIAAAADSLDGSPLCGVDLARLARDVRAAGRAVPLAQPIEEVVKDNQLRHVTFDEKRRRRLRRPLVKALVGMRSYAAPALESLLGADADALAEVLGNLLCHEGLRTPGYTEIYCNIAASPEGARQDRAAIEDWHENAYVVLDPAAYRRAAQSKRRAMLAAAYRDGLLALAAVDGLDRKLIDRVIKLVSAEGSRSELHGPCAESSTHRAEVRFRLEPGAGRCRAAFTLAVTDLRSRQRADHGLGVHDTWWWPFRFAKVSLTRTTVRIDAARSERAEVYLKSTPRRIELRLTDLFAAPSPGKR